MNPTLLSVLSPLARQYGIGMIFAGVFAMAAERIYTDFKEQTAALVSLIKEQSSASREVADALRELVQKVGESNRK